MKRWPIVTASIGILLVPLHGCGSSSDQNGTTLGASPGVVFTDVDPTNQPETIPQDMVRNCNFDHMSTTNIFAGICGSGPPPIPISAKFPVTETSTLSCQPTTSSEWEFATPAPGRILLSFLSYNTTYKRCVDAICTSGTVRMTVDSAKITLEFHDLVVSGSRNGMLSGKVICSR